MTHKEVFAHSTLVLPPDEQSKYMLRQKVLAGSTRLAWKQSMGRSLKRSYPIDG